MGAAADGILRAEPRIACLELSRLLAQKREQQQQLSEAEALFVRVDTLMVEVMTGGFQQYFFNPPGDAAALTLQGLDQIGARASADLLRRAMALFPGGPPEDHLARQRALLQEDAARATAFAAIDEAFQAYPDPVEALLVAHVRAHGDQFD